MYEFLLQSYGFCCDFMKRTVVLHKQHGGLEFLNQILDLHARKHVDEVQRFIPEVEVRVFAQAFGQQDFFSFGRR